jgi:hypothetical protein
MSQNLVENLRYDSKTFSIGNYRPIYLWAGPGTVRMNRLKFMNVNVDEKVHDQAHTSEGARRVVDELHCNWVHLTYNWGFPPEIEQEDWESFRQAAMAYHQFGSPVFAYFQSSNCVYTGSFIEKDWYARDPSGKPITYFTYGGRYMVCFLSQAWREHLKGLVSGAIERGADGIFFDNLFFGNQPLSAFGSLLGNAGCFCTRCQDAYYRFSGESIPRNLIEEPARVAHYLRWRADQVSNLIEEIANHARREKPDIPIAANDFDPILRNSYLIYGIDLVQLSHHQDVVMIENFGLPSWQPGTHPRLTNNALTIRTARPLVDGNAHLSVLSYDVGIGFDSIYSIRRYLQALAEASALGVSMTIKGTEYHDGEKMTLLTADEYSPVRHAIGHYHRWLDHNHELFSPERRNIGQIGLYFPGNDLWLQWLNLAPVYFEVCQALTAEGYPWKVVKQDDDLSGLRCLLTFGSPLSERMNRLDGIEVIDITTIPEWQALVRSDLIGKNANLHHWVSVFYLQLLKAYSDKRVIREVSDRIGLQKIVTQSPFYNLPGVAQRKSITRFLPKDLTVRVQSKHPVLIECWDHNGVTQIHLVNYAAEYQEIVLLFGQFVKLVVDSPDEKRLELQGIEIELKIDIYALLTLNSNP